MFGVRKSVWSLRTIEFNKNKMLLFNAPNVCKIIKYVYKMMSSEVFMISCSSKKQIFPRKVVNKFAILDYVENCILSTFDNSQREYRIRACVGWFVDFVAQSDNLDLIDCLIDKDGPDNQNNFVMPTKTFIELLNRYEFLVENDELFSTKHTQNDILIRYGKFVGLENESDVSIANFCRNIHPSMIEYFHFIGKIKNVPSCLFSVPLEHLSDFRRFGYDTKPFEIYAVEQFMPAERWTFYQYITEATVEPFVHIIMSDLTGTAFRYLYDKKLVTLSDEVLDVACKTNNYNVIKLHCVNGFDIGIKKIDKILSIDRNALRFCNQRKRKRIIINGGSCSIGTSIKKYSSGSHKMTEEQFEQILIMSETLPKLVCDITFVATLIYRRYFRLFKNYRNDMPRMFERRIGRFVIMLLKKYCEWGMLERAKEIIDNDIVTPEKLYNNSSLLIRSMSHKHENIVDWLVNVIKMKPVSPRQLGSYRYSHLNKSNIISMMIKYGMMNNIKSFLTYRNLVAHIRRGDLEIVKYIYKNIKNKLSRKRKSGLIMSIINRTLTNRKHVPWWGVQEIIEYFVGQGLTIPQTKLSTFAPYFAGPISFNRELVMSYLLTYFNSKLIYDDVEYLFERDVSCDVKIKLVKILLKLNPLPTLSERTIGEILKILITQIIFCSRYDNTESDGKVLKEFCQKYKCRLDEKIAFGDLRPIGLSADDNSQTIAKLIQRGVIPMPSEKTTELLFGFGHRSIIDYADVIPNAKMTQRKLFIAFLKDYNIENCLKYDVKITPYIAEKYITMNGAGVRIERLSAILEHVDGLTENTIDTLIDIKTEYQLYLNDLNGNKGGYYKRHKKIVRQKLKIVDELLETKDIVEYVPEKGELAQEWERDNPANW